MNSPASGSPGASLSGPPEVSCLLALGLPERRGLAGKGRVRQAGGSCPSPHGKLQPLPPTPTFLPDNKNSPTCHCWMAAGCRHHVQVHSLST